jgi:hypothetical protein
MFVTMNRIPVNPEHAERFEENFRQRARLVDRMPGFIRNLVPRPANPADELYGGNDLLGERSPLPKLADILPGLKSRGSYTELSRLESA